MKYILLSLFLAFSAHAQEVRVPADNSGKFIDPALQDCLCHVPVQPCHDCYSPRGDVNVTVNVTAVAQAEAKAEVKPAPVAKAAPKPAVKRKVKQEVCGCK